MYVFTLCACLKIVGTVKKSVQSCEQLIKIPYNIDNNVNLFLSTFLQFSVFNTDDLLEISIIRKKSVLFIINLSFSFVKRLIYEKRFQKDSNCHLLDMIKASKL